MLKTDGDVTVPVQDHTLLCVCCSVCLVIVMYLISIYKGCKMHHLEKRPFSSAVVKLSVLHVMKKPAGIFIVQINLINHCCPLQFKGQHGGNRNEENYI